ncbi:hypothetical protein [Allonocardiopsis opalescens]|nr:hypothetical protein [Allonocardiopsis opalescens]
MAALWWIEMVRELRLDADLTAVAESLARHANPSGKDSNPGRKKVSQDTGLPPNDVTKAFRKLQSIGVLDVARDYTPQGFTLYLLVDPSKPHRDQKNDILMPTEDVKAPSDALLIALPPLSEAHAPHKDPNPRGSLMGVAPASIYPKSTPRRRPVRGQSKPEHPVKRKGVRRKETILYRYYDDKDVLLYVGVSANMPGRLEGHEDDSTWMDFAARSTLEHFTDRADAEAAEITAIETDRPIFNILHNENPDRVRRIVDYLIDRDRRDLLVPLISRG